MRTLLRILKRSVIEIGFFLQYYFLTLLILIGSLIFITSVIEVYERYTVNAISVATFALALVLYLFSKTKHWQLYNGEIKYIK